MAHLAIFSLRVTSHVVGTLSDNGMGIGVLRKTILGSFNARNLNLDLVRVCSNLLISLSSLYYPRTYPCVSLIDSYVSLSAILTNVREKIVLCLDSILDFHELRDCLRIRLLDLPGVHIGLFWPLQSHCSFMRRQALCTTAVELTLHLRLSTLMNLSPFPSLFLLRTAR